MACYLLHQTWPLLLPQHPVPSPPTSFHGLLVVATPEAFGRTFQVKRRQRYARCHIVLGDTATFTDTMWDAVCWNLSSLEGKLATLKQESSPSDKCLRIFENNGAYTPPVHWRDISIYTNSWRLKEALQAVDFMDQQGSFFPVEFYFQLLQRSIAENNLPMGREVHYFIVRNGLGSDVFLGSHLIRMYGSFSILVEASQVFNKLHEPSVFAWGAIISAHANLEQNEKAINLYNQMQRSGMEPDGHVFVAVLKACATTVAISQGKQTHAHIIESGFESDVFVGSTLIDMYANCESIHSARTVFDRLPQRNMVSWNALITGYIKHGYGQEALQVFHLMQGDGIHPDKVTFVCILKACSSLAALEQGKQIHSHIIESGFHSNLSVGNTLINMYAKCGRLQDARTWFDRLPEQNVVTWSVLIAGYAQHGHCEEAFHLFQQMQQEGMEPNQVTFLCMLKACSSTSACELGKKIHSCISERGYESDLSVGSALVDMYAKCGSLYDAYIMFNRLPMQNSVTWNTLIGGYAQHGHGQEALKVFQHMQQQGIEPDHVTFACILKACSSAQSLEQGKQIHAHIIQSRSELDMFVGNTLVDMYAKCGSFQDAQIVFDSLPSRNVVTWSALIAGYVQHGHCQEALKLFQQMQQEVVEPNDVTFVCMLKACSNMAALGHGKLIHSQIIKYGLDFDLCLGSALIDMYAKCGTLQDAHLVFDRLPMRDVVTWSALIAGHAHHNDYVSALEYFEAMQHAGLKPDNVTFLCLLSACSHAGVVSEGCFHFKSMVQDHGISPALEHHNSLVDLFGHGGCLYEAEDLLETIPFQSNIVGWKSLLTSCKTHGNVHLGRRCFDQIITLEPGNATGYVLMSSIYSFAGMGEEAERTDEVRRYTGAWKKPAKAFIEIDNQVHAFTVGDKSHPLSDDIHAKLRALNIQLQKAGHIPRFDLVLDSVTLVDKEDILCGHCEKLAIAFGLISTPQGATIRVSKNFRVCGDCHVATKIISKLEKREIIIADTYCIHQFKDGACSCKGY